MLGLQGDVDGDVRLVGAGRLLAATLAHPRGPPGPASRTAGRPGRGRSRRCGRGGAAGSAGSCRDRVGGLVGRVATEDPVPQRAHAGRHLVDRRRGDDQDAEHRQQHEQGHHDVRRPQEVQEQARHDEADGPARLLQVGAVAEPRRGVAVGDVHDAQDTEGERGPADDLATGRTVALGVAQGAPAHEDEHQRDQPGDLADRAGDHGPQTRHHRARELPPHGPAVTTASPTSSSPAPSRRCSGSRSRAAPPIRRAAPPSAWATASHACAERAEHAEDRARAAAHGSGRGARGQAAGTRRLRRSASARAAGTPGSGARTASTTASRRALAPRPRRGRRTGRHAATLGDRHTSITLHRSVSRPRPWPPGSRRRRSSGRLEPNDRLSRNWIVKQGEPCLRYIRHIPERGTRLLAKSRRGEYYALVETIPTPSEGSP